MPQQEAEAEEAPSRSGCRMCMPACHLQVRPEPVVYGSEVLSSSLLAVTFPPATMLYRLLRPR